MKILLRCFLCAILLAFGAQAHALLITPSSTPLIGSGPDTSQAAINAILLGLIGTDVELYKQDVGGGESGILAGSYETDFFNTPSAPSEATITYTSGPIVGSTSHLLVKDGNQNPAWYLFELAPGMGWNGTETLYLERFWPNQGTISHVSLYGNPQPVPEPATLLLIGTGIFGFALFRRKKIKV